MKNLNFKIINFEIGCKNFPFNLFVKKEKERGK